MTATATANTGIVNSLTTGRLPKWVPWVTLAASWVIVAAIFGLMSAANGGELNIAVVIFLGTILFDVALFVLAYLVEGVRQAKDRLVTSLVSTAFIIALIPLISLLYTVVSNGLARFDPLFFSSSMRNVVGEGGGALHAITGTLLITGAATLISVPVGLLTAIYLVEYGKGALARAITFFVDVMTGIPSIVAGLFVFAFWVIALKQGYSGLAASFALTILMLPVVVRSSEEMIKLVPAELRLLHCEDFRDDARYDFHRDNLIRQLREPAPPLGKLIAVPDLPVHFLSRTERLCGCGTPPAAPCWPSCAGTNAG